MENKNTKKVSADEYDSNWIKTYGWDTPEEFIRSQGRNLRPRVRYAIDMADISPGMNILDIGCGRGEVVFSCARKGIRALGVDYSEEAISIAQKTKASYDQETQKRMDFICEDIEKIEFTESYDRIFMLDLVEHLYDWELLKLFKTCSSLLKPDGAIIIHTLPNKWLYDITYKKIIRLFAPWLPSNPRTQKQMSIHVNEMSIIHLSQILKKCGFSSRIWIKDLLVEQAKWHKKKPHEDMRGKLYKWFSNPIIGLFYRIISKTPFRLLIVNEMFAVAWKGIGNTPLKIPFCNTERFMIKLFLIFNRHVNNQHVD